MDKKTKRGEAEEKKRRDNEESIKKEIAKEEIAQAGRARTTAFQDVSAIARPPFLPGYLPACHPTCLSHGRPTEEWTNA